MVTWIKYDKDFGLIIVSVNEWKMMDKNIFENVGNIFKHFQTNIWEFFCNTQ